MKKRCFKRASSITIALALVLGLFAVPQICAYAEDDQPIGLAEPIIENREVSEEEYNEVLLESYEADKETFVENYYKGTDGFWYQFSSPYYNYSFSRLNDNQKALYNALYSKLMSYVEGGSDFKKDPSSGIYLTPAVEYTGLTEDEAMSVAYLLMYETPELYYLNQYVGVYASGLYGKTVVRIGVYDEMHTGTQRTYYASKIKSKIKWYLSQVSTGASTYDKEKTIHDLLCDNCMYGSSDTPFNQSCASVFLNSGGETVCAGYSEAFALLCYACGIPAMSITSRGHEWNQVKIGSFWYAVDVTWDDVASNRYKYFNKSDDTMLVLSRASHTLEALWSLVGREKCPYDWGSEMLPSGIYLNNHTYNNITAGMVVGNEYVSKLDFMWLGYDINKNKWFVISDWTRGNVWCSWNPGKTGQFLLLCRARWHSSQNNAAEACIGITHKQCINGICQMPNTSWGGGVLLGLSTFDNPNNSYRYEIQILDCSLFAAGNPYPWIYTTGRINVKGGSSAWAVWRPNNSRGYYLTLFRVYDVNGEMLDEECFGFVL